MADAYDRFETAHKQCSVRIQPTSDGICTKPLTFSMFDLSRTLSCVIKAQLTYLFYNSSSLPLWKIQQ